MVPVPAKLKVPAVAIPPAKLKAELLAELNDEVEGTVSRPVNVLLPASSSSVMVAVPESVVAPPAEKVEELKFRLPD